MKTLINTFAESQALYQHQHFAKVHDDGSHEVPVWAAGNLWGTNCGAITDGATPCTPGVDTWNYTFVYPESVAGADPNGEGDMATSEGGYVVEVSRKDIKNMRNELTNSILYLFLSFADIVSRGLMLIPRCTRWQDQFLSR